MSGENRSEQPTQRRRQKAREQGRVATTPELGGALGLCAALWILAAKFGAGVGAWRETWLWALQTAAAPPSAERGALVGARVAWTWLVPALSACFAIAMLSAVGQGGLVFVPASLRPSLQRISPAAKLKQIFSTTSLVSLGKSLLPAVAITYLVCAMFARDWRLMSQSAGLHSRAFAPALADCLVEAAWKCGLVLLVWAVVDFFAKRRKFELDLRMTQQEVREEIKESEGNPQIKARIRKLQRQVRRKRMIEDVAKAAVVITNPTSYAIALEYHERLAAPVVVAKGRNLVAQQIKQAALWHEVPTVENVPLAHALYRTAEVGQSIPAKLYAAVAEVLAFVFRAQARVACAGGSR